MNTHLITNLSHKHGIHFEQRICKCTMWKGACVLVDIITLTFFGLSIHNEELRQAKRMVGKKEHMPK